MVRSSCALALGIAAWVAASCGSSSTPARIGSGNDASSGSDSTSGSGSSPDSGGSSEGGGDAGTGADAHGDETVADSGSPSSPSFILGADITFTQQDIASGATFVDKGVPLPILRLLKNHGFNYIRLRTFVDPTQPAPNPAGGTFAPYSPQGFADLTHTVAFGQEIKAAGMGFLLDFHYSDTWADPGKQIKPAAWANDDLPTLTTALHDYTLNAIQRLVAAGARPDMVQVGNEITPGMELTPGTAFGPTSNWKQLAQLLNAGIGAIRQVDPTITIMLHIDKGGDLNTSVTYINNAIANGVTFDVFGESCYVAFQGQPSGWQTTFNGLAAKFPNMKFVMAEYNADPANQTDTELRQANDIVFNLPNHRGLGTFFWEPTRHVNGNNPGIFTVTGNVYTPISACIDQYDQMKAAYGL
jgi:arabinogalactan endo-1,4-beta-galactosidase